MSRPRLRPLVADSLLALALAVVALGLMETSRSVNEGGPVPGWSVNPPPRDIRAGDVWNARISVSAAGKVAPLLTVQNVRTGTLTSTEATPVGKLGIYRARVLFPEAGDYTYSVQLADAPEEPAPGGPGSPAGLVLLTLLATLPIALRRRFPLPVLGVTLAAALAAGIAYASFAWLGSLVALYSVAAHVRRPRSLYAAAAVAAALPLLLVGVGLGFWEIVAIYAVFAAAWLLGDGMRSRRERKQAHVQRTAAEEQARMARELHDIIGHSVSVMTIQAAAAGDAFDQRPAQVREALRAIESTGRETLAELRRLLAGVNGSFAPAPGLQHLDELAGRVRSAGLAVELSGRPASLPPSVDLAAYRIVQEALTNTLKHARATTARVTVREAGGALEIEVVDDGRGSAPITPGHGIIGMRERAAAFGGDLTAGPAPGGGFAVRARIPVT
jgi:signal transduction histidine kinase